MVIDDARPDEQAAEVRVGPVARLQARLVEAAVADDGMSTAEYAIGTIAAAAFGAVLYTVVTGDSVVTALTGIVQRALSTQV
ncbi:DUF4244 domain-containing protein [Rhodococcus aerolatus]